MYEPVHDNYTVTCLIRGKANGLLSDVRKGWAMTDCCDPSPVLPVIRHQDECGWWPASSLRKEALQCSRSKHDERRLHVGGASSHSSQAPVAQQDERPYLGGRVEVRILDGVLINLRADLVAIPTDRHPAGTADLRGKSLPCAGVHGNRGVAGVDGLRLSRARFAFPVGSPFKSGRRCKREGRGSVRHGCIATPWPAPHVNQCTM